MTKIQFLSILTVYIYTVSIKTRHLIFYHNFGKYKPISKILVWYTLCCIIPQRGPGILWHRFDFKMSEGSESDKMF